MVEKSWFSYNANLEVHRGLFNIGILITRLKNGRSLSDDKITDNTFPLGDRTFNVFTMGRDDETQPLISPKAAVMNRACAVLESVLDSTLKGHVEHFIKPKKPDPQNKKAAKAKDHHHSWKADQESVCLFNSRYDEVFLPIFFKQDSSGFYVYPWLSRAETKPPSMQIENFVTAGCLFGTDLLGEDDYEARRPIIKHDIRFSGDLKIEEIHCTKTSPYETILFHELRMKAKFVASFGEGKELIYHLPYYDYVLFGMELFFKNRITLEALEVFFEHIFLRKEEHIEKINAICQEYNIVVHIQSPFDNVFYTDTPIVTKEDFVVRIREVLKDFFVKKGKEEELVIFLKNQLTNHTLPYKIHSEIWQGFLSLTGTVDTIEGLFRVANAVIVGVASYGKEDNRTCSLLPLSEKPIQNQYVKYVRQSQEKESAEEKVFYPSVTNFTTFDPVLSFFSEKNQKNGLIFYFHYLIKSPNERPLKYLFEESILLQASRNIKKFAGNEISVDFSQIMQEESQVSVEDHKQYKRKNSSDSPTNSPPKLFSPRLCPVPGGVANSHHSVGRRKSIG